MATEDIDGLSVDLDQLPEDLRDLAPEIRRWAVRDESERAQRIEGTSTDELASFWLRVSQEFPSINAYLDTRLEGEPTNEALVLGATAEAGLAAAAEVENRTGKRPGG